MGAGFPTPMNRTERRFLICTNAIRDGVKTGNMQAVREARAEYRNLFELIGVKRVHELWDIQESGEPG